MRHSVFKGLLLIAYSTAGLVPMTGSATLNDTSDGRTITALSEWRFIQDASEEESDIRLPMSYAEGSTVQLPHCFRLSGLPEKSAGFYSATVDVPAEDANKCFYLFMEGAGSVADVFVNGKHVGQHKGAYTAAWIDLTPGLEFGRENEVVVRVTNRDKEAANCLSQSVLFYTNGGLYRPVWLVKTLGVHIFPDMGSTGVYLTPKNISTDSAELEMTTHVRNALKKDMQVVVRNTITDPAGNKVGEVEGKVTVPAGMTKAVTTRKNLANPVMWNMHDGQLYTVYTEVVAGGKVADAITERTGIRTIRMKDGDFVLNGKTVLVRGVCKHHQDEHVWNAMTDEQLKWEMDGMMDLGVNTIRLAHYPHRRFEYNMADEHGVLVWAENGLAGQNWDKGDMKNRETRPTEDGDRITSEMVMQNWNHPSIVFWSSGNETHDEVASHYADTIRKLDETRLVTYALAPGHGDPENLDFVAGNTYAGWYWGHYTDFKELPANEYVSETGAGCWITQHLPYGVEEWKVDHFESEEYAQSFAEFRFQTIFRNNPAGHKFFLWWNYREFYDHKFKNNRNTKGILTLAGMPKDYYYHFQSFLRPDHPVLHLCGRHYFYRQIDPTNGIKAYSNAKTVTLSINGKSYGAQENGSYILPGTSEKVDNVFFWKAPLEPGRNRVTVVDDRGNEQAMVIYQKPEAGAMPPEPDSIVSSLESSNPDNPAVMIHRGIEAQGPIYYEVDGSSDNTFDALPEEVEGAYWIATKRLSDEKNKTDLRFKTTRPATVYVMYGTGTYPAHTLDQPNEGIMRAAKALKADLSKAGFSDTDTSGIWRRHNLWLADTGLMSRSAKAGDTITIPGQTLDYVVLIKPIM